MDRANKKTYKKFTDQRSVRTNDGFEWRLTYNEWCDIWEASGKWNLRGKHRGQYVMARIGDVGPYAVGNVEIITHSQNIKDAFTNGCHDNKPSKPHSAETKRKMSETRKGRVKSEEHRRNLSESHLGKLHDPMAKETKLKISKALKGMPKSEEAKANMRAAWLLRKQKAEQEKR